ncbi:hypothetical protein EAG_02151 [Camponotus floridanus]|uniref:Uncharacterized protein n=1 Tax=Camponotus floridanus TaxID=104421 RepID=E2A8A0_CAMFO|nr:hypothetical protein EAG_02151 [Camponotus floridanus]
MKLAFAFMIMMAIPMISTVSSQSNSPSEEQVRFGVCNVLGIVIPILVEELKSIGIC